MIKHAIHRSRKTIWFSPPYSRIFKTNIFKKLLQLIRKNFNKNPKLNRTFNKNTLKLSYCSIPNICSVVKQQNERIWNDEAKSHATNYRVKDNFPLNGKCLDTCIIYKANVITDTKNFTYFGACEGNLKTTTTTTRSGSENDTELSKLILNLNDNSKILSIEYKTVSYKCGSQGCKFCLSEKVSSEQNPRIIKQKN